MLIKFDADDEFVNTLKAETNRNVASKAYALAAREFLAQKRLIADMKCQISSMQLTLEKQDKLISSAEELVKAFAKYFMSDSNKVGN